MVKVEKKMTKGRGQVVKSIRTASLWLNRGESSKQEARIMWRLYYSVLPNSVAAQKKRTARASLSFFEAEEAALVMRVVALCALRRLCCLFRHQQGMVHKQDSAVISLESTVRRGLVDAREPKTGGGLHSL